MPLIITIDGPAAAGKSSVARALAKKLNLIYLDSGSLYRAMAWKVIQKGNLTQQAEIELFCQTLNVEIRSEASVWVDSENVTPFLRDQEVTQASSILSTYPGVRAKLLLIQRAVAKAGAVAEGRDVGTVVFPHADFKFYLDADLTARGVRRFKEFSAKGIACDQKTVTDEIGARDQRDCHRAIAPLRAADDAIVIDSTPLSLEAVLALMMQKIESAS